MKRNELQVKFPMKTIIGLLAFGLMILSGPGIRAQIVINEFLAVNQNVNSDEHGEYDDWIEIFNTGSIPVNLGGMYITDTLGDLTLFQIASTLPDETTVQPGEFILFWADGEPWQGVRHLGFKLGSGGEEIALVDPDGSTIIDFIIFNDQYEDVSYGVYPEGSENWQYMDPTPLASNTTLNILEGDLYINEFMASNDRIIADANGDYDDWIEIYNPNDFPVNIGGIFVTDNIDNPAKYRIPDHDPDSTTIPSHGYLLIWADSDDEQGILHTTFKLSATGEDVGIVHSNGVDFIDVVSFGGQLTDVSFGRYHDGEDSWRLFTVPTPLAANILAGTGNYFSSGFSLSPNPAASNITIRLHDIIKNEVAVGLYDLTGKLLLSAKYENTDEIQLDLSEYNSGLYFVKITAGQATFSTKLILR